MKRKIIMKDKPLAGDEEIHRYMDFNALVSAHRLELQRRRTTKRYRSAGLTVTAVAVMVTTWFMVRPAQENDAAPSSSPAVQQTETLPSPSPDSIAKKDRAENQAPGRAMRNTETHRQPSEQKGQVAPQTIAPKDSAGQAKPTNSVPVYIQAEPVAGYPALYAYFMRELEYPAEAVADSVQGVVSVMFTINVQGKPEKIQVEQSLSPALDREAMRVIANMPAWKPATYNQKPVPSRISLPLTFQIKKIRQP